MAKRISAIQLARRIALGIILLGMTALTILHQKMQGIPSIDAMDPFGGLETLMKFVAGGEFIKKIEPGNIVLLGGIIALGVVLSRFFCGWFCAFGALQGVFGWIGRKIFKRRFTVPAKLDRALRWLKYPALAAILFFTWRAGELVIRPYDPLAAYGHLSAGMAAVWAEFAVGFVLLVATFVLSALYERAFCKYLCPLGAVNAILGRVSLFRIKRTESTCISCSKCDKVCPMNIDVSGEKSVDSPECISCMECVTACPTKEDTLATTLGGKKLRTSAIVIIGFAIFAGAALAGQLTGMLRFSAPSLGSIAKQGRLKVEDIKGSSTYGSVAESFGIEIDRLYREVGIDPKRVPSDTMIKDTGKFTGAEGFEADAVRAAVARILGIPYAGESAQAGPPAAKVEAEKVAPVKAEAVTSDAAKPADSATANNATVTVPPDFLLEGTMTISDIARTLNATAEAIRAKLGLPADIPEDKPLKDMKDEYGFSMPSLKVKIKE